MNITLKATNYEVTPDARGLIESKLGLIQKFVKHDPAALLEIELEQMVVTEKDGTRFRAEANLATEGKLYRAEARAASVETAIEKVRHELEAELRRDRGRARKLFRKGGAALKNALRFGR